MDDGSIQVEKFDSTRDTFYAEELKQLFVDFDDKNVRQIGTFLKDLDERKIYYRVNKIREDAVMVEITVPGQFWEVEFMDDGSIEIPKFISCGEISVCQDINRCKEIEQLFDNYDSAENWLLKRRKAVEDGKYRIIKISEKALLEFIQTKFEWSEGAFFDVDILDVTSCLEIDLGTGDLMCLIYKAEDKQGNRIRLPEEVDLEKLLRNMEDTKSTLLALDRYVELSLDQILEIQARDSGKPANKHPGRLSLQYTTLECRPLDRLPL